MDPELTVMQKVSDLLADLDADARQRVVSWIIDRFSLSQIKKPNLPTIGSLEDGSPVAENGQQFKDFAEFFHAVDPKDYSERALAAAFWLSEQTDGDPFAAQAVNNLLKNTGYQVANITDSLTQNIKDRPANIIQTRKSGNSRQARKLYKITDSGRRKIKAMLANDILQIRGISNEPS